MDVISRSLIAAQNKAQALFDEVVAGGMIQPGKLESELSDEIHALAQSRFGLRRHWHKRIARSGPNTLLTYHDPDSDRRITDDDVVYLDFGPVFDEWEADFGRTYALGRDPAKHRLVADIAAAFRRGKQLYLQTPDLTAGQLYDFVAALATPAGWEFGAPTAGHLIGRFPMKSRGRTRGVSQSVMTIASVCARPMSGASRATGYWKSTLLTAAAASAAFSKNC